MNDQGTRKEKNWFDFVDRAGIFRISTFLGVGFILLYLCIPILIPLTFQGSIFDGRTGQVGDTFGGTLGPIVAMTGVILTFWAFWTQYKANDQQKRDLQIERFESRLVSMLETHRNTVAEIRIQFPFLVVIPPDEAKGHRVTGGADNLPLHDRYELRSHTYEGRTAFVEMMSYLRNLYLFLECKNKALNTEDQATTQLLFEIAYLIFFLGTEDEVEGSGKKFKAIGEHPFLGIAVDAVKKEKSQREGEPYDFLGALAAKDGLSIATIRVGTYSAVVPRYPFGIGHSAWLSHYFRHLFMMVEYVHRQEFLNYEQKFDYVRQIRAQLSVHEQQLLFYNSRSVFGRPWKHNSEMLDLLMEYCMVKSISPYATFYESPFDAFGQKEKNRHGKWLFDLLKIQERNLESK